MPPPQVFCSGIAILIGSLAMANGHASEKLSITADLKGAGWHLLTIPGKTPTQFIGHDDGTIEVRANESVAFLYRALQSRARKQPFLRWRWRVDEPIAGMDLSRKGADDRPLAVHVVFTDDSPPAGLWGALERGIFSWTSDVPFAGKLITYVWGGTGKRGTQIPNPYADGRGVIFILRPASTVTGQWLREKIAVAGDFERAFGYPGPAPAYVLVSADADDTRARSLGWVADMLFTDE